MNDVVVELVSVLSQDLPHDEAVTRLLRAMVERLEWDVANLWVPEEEGTDELRFAGTWHDPSLDVEAFIAACCATLRPRARPPWSGLVDGVPVTIADLDADPTFTRSEPASAHICRCLRARWRAATGSSA